jgi:hypothetical protein
MSTNDRPTALETTCSETVIYTEGRQSGLHVNTTKKNQKGQQLKEREGQE